MDTIIRLAGGLGARIVPDSEANEFRFTVPADMQLFIECVTEMGWFPCDDWFLMTVLVVKENPACDCEEQGLQFICCKKEEYQIAYAAAMAYDDDVMDALEYCPENDWEEMAINSEHGIPGRVE